MHIALLRATISIPEARSLKGKRHKICFIRMEGKLFGDMPIMLYYIINVSVCSGPYICRHPSRFWAPSSS